MFFNTIFFDDFHLSEKLPPLTYCPELSSYIFRRLPLKTFNRTVLLFVFLVALLASCGYHNPYVYNGPAKTIYITEWKNRTSVLSLDSKIYRSLAKWYQKAGSLHVTKKKDGADLILAGEIVSISLPSLGYGAKNQSVQNRVRLRVRYILKDIASGKVLMEEANEIWDEPYLTSSSAAVASDNETTALDTIIDQLSQKIYQRTLVQIPKL